TSAMMPPKFPATNDRTRTPNRSSRRLTPAMAPLSAKTKVPSRSSSSRSVFIAVAGPERTQRTLPARSAGPGISLLYNDRLSFGPILEGEMAHETTRLPAVQITTLGKATRAESDEQLLESWLASLASAHSRRNFEVTARRFLAQLPAGGLRANGGAGVEGDARSDFKRSTYWRPVASDTSRVMRSGASRFKVRSDTR